VDNPAIVSLPNGLLSDGSRVRNARLRELNGYDEQLFGEPEGTGSSPLRTTELLDRVATLEPSSRSTTNRDLVRQLTAGDRVALLLQLRRLTFGDKMGCVVTCPYCAEEMSVELSARKLLQPQTHHHPSPGDAVNVEGHAFRVRPVTGADLEALSPSGDQSRLAEELVRSCILSSEPPPPPRLSEGMMAALSAKLEELDPQADIVLDLSCPACRQPFKTPFLIEDFILRELRSRMSQLENEVHWIAFNYHWNEDEILSLPMRRRKRYVDLINRSLSGESLP
jgi:hypothetical protein